MYFARGFLGALVVASSVLSTVDLAVGQKPTSATSRAVSLFSKRQYNDAIRLLLADIKGKPVAQCAQSNLLLGESYYQTGRFGDARPYLENAVRHLPEGKNKITAEQRLVAVAYRLNDFEGANDRIDAFLARHADDRRVGKVLAYKMLIAARGGPDAQPRLEQMHEQIQKAIDKYGHTTGMEADRILCDFYRQHGQLDKARDVYARIVHNFRKVIAQRQSNKQRIPAAFEKTHDNAAIQLGAIYIERKQASEAIKWLENVRFDQSLKQQARLLLAKLSYEGGQFDKAIGYLTADGFLETVPAGRLKSDMYLLLGLAEKGKPNGDGSRVEQYLRQVGPESKGYLQAQAAIGDIYLKKELHVEAERAYLNVLEAPQYEPQALLALGRIYVAQGRQAAEKSRQTELFRKASDKFNTLFARHPLSPLIEPAREQIEFLRDQGVDVSFALSEDEKLRTWQNVADSKQGTVAGARALLRLLRTYARRVVDPKTGKLLKAPNYAACAKACDRLLDENIYKGDGFTSESWRALRAEALWQRAECEIASVAQDTEASPPATQAQVVPGATVAKAIERFRAAKSLVDPKQLDLLKNIELGLLEAMFKSDEKETLKEAEQRFQKLEADYGNDDRFQQLAINLADWYKREGRLTEAARQFAGVADRGQDLDDEQRMQLLYASGSLYSQAGREAQKDPAAQSYAIFIYPQEVIQLGGVLQTHRPLQRQVQLEFPNGGRGMLAGDALLAVSKAAGVPFIWMPEDGGDTIANYLKNHRLDLPDGAYRARDAVEQILDVKRHHLELDVGLTGGQPTLPPAEVDADNPDAPAAQPVIEIYDIAQADRRYRPLTSAYGAFNSVHGSGFGVTLFRVLRRIEELAETRVLWADGIDRDEMLATEFKNFPELDPNADASCARILRGMLDQLELRYRIVRRHQSDELYESAFAQFNKIRQIQPKSEYGEKSLFRLAVNFYSQQDYPKMKIVLREYLKMFDGPSYKYYRPACFWVGWAFEHEKNYQEAVQYYRRAAEERLVIYKPRENEPLPDREQLRALLSYDLAFALMEDVGGEFSDASIDDLVDFVQVNAQVDIQLDPTAQSISGTVNRARFRETPAWDVMCDALQELGLTFRVENVDEEIAQKAYFRLASAYEKDSLMQQALENCRTLLARYPQTERRADVYRLLIDIYKGLKDYGSVLATLEQFKATAGDTLDKYLLDFEIGRIYFDMAAYAKAAESFREALAAAKNPADRIAIRDGYAKALYRDGKLQDALAQFETLVKNELDPLRRFVAEQMVFLIRFQREEVLEREYPEELLRFIQTYERLSDESRARLTRTQFARATWIYYVLGIVDLEKNRVDAALTKLSAVTTSPDEFLAADAAYRVGLIHMRQKHFEQAREAFEHLLFATSSPESAVRATYALGLCLEKLGQPKRAAARYQQLIDRYPRAPYVEQIKSNPVYQASRNAAAKPDQVPVTESKDAESKNE